MSPSLFYQLLSCINIYYQLNISFIFAQQCVLLIIVNNYIIVDLLMIVNQLRCEICLVLTAGDCEYSVGLEYLVFINSLLPPVPAACLGCVQWMDAR